MQPNSAHGKGWRSVDNPLMGALDSPNDQKHLITKYTEDLVTGAQAAVSRNGSISGGRFIKN